MKRTVVFIFFPLILAGFLRCTSDKAGQTQTGLDIL